ncbi:hypothetical protein K439DRAFT_1410208 [Ramaria rubella]|nr:hypothetical protein K439DRAFT_1410208 [Ramaria rubella]
MKGYFPTDHTTCPQSLSHKSVLVSEPSVHPNVLVQHADSFIVTFHAATTPASIAPRCSALHPSWIELGCAPRSARVRRNRCGSTSGSSLKLGSGRRTRRLRRGL